jgi:hypothetical protein
MARIDKYNGVVGGFRARLGFTPLSTEVGDIIAVAINGSGLAVKATALNAEGVIVLSSLLALNDPVDVMTDGEVVDVTDADNITGRAAGAKIFAGAAGVVNVTAPAAGVNGVSIGTMVENWRLVVRIQKTQG